MICSCFRRTASGRKRKSEEDKRKKTSKDIEKQISGWVKEYSKAIKILLLGSGESGKTTILKQMKILHVQGFTVEERKRETKLIRINMLEAIKEIMYSLYEWIPGFEFNDRASFDAFEFIEQLKITNIDSDDNFVFGSKYFESIKTVWLDKNVQAHFSQLGSFSILDSAKYYLDKIDEISLLSYVAEDDDILRSRRRTTEIQKLEFNMKIPNKYGGGSQLFWVFDVGGQKGERRKWIQVFEGISAILFLVSASEFDMKTREKHKNKIKRRNSRSSLRSLNEQRFIQPNRMDDSLSLFRDICESRFLEYCGMICFLNKQDILRDKIVNKGYKMIDYFPNYNQFEYEPKITSLTENGQEYSANRTKYLKSFFKVGKMSRQCSLNSFNNLEPMRITENLDDSDSIVNLNMSSNFFVNLPSNKNSYSENLEDQASRMEKRSYMNSFKSLEDATGDQVSTQLEYEYLKARCYVKNLFVKVAEESFEKKIRKSSNNSGQAKKPRERECFFHYTVATDTTNIKKVFDDVHLMIILNNINQCMIL